MARRTFQVVDITEILVHWHAGRSISEVARSLGVDRNTVRKYIAPAVAAGIVPGDQPFSPQRWQELVRGWFPRLAWGTEIRSCSSPVLMEEAAKEVTSVQLAGVILSCRTYCMCRPCSASSSRRFRAC